MMRAAALCLAICLPGAGLAQGAAGAARMAAADLTAAIVAMEAASTSRDRVAALTQTIRAYETGLAALRDGLRQAKVREASLLLQFDAQRGRVAQLLAVLGQMEATPAPLLLLHPSGPLGTVRSGMMLSEVTPALQAEVTRLQGELAELRDLRAVQDGAMATLAGGLQAAQEARTALSQAISDRATLPRRFTEDPQALSQLLQGADTLDAFAAGLMPLPDETQPLEFEAVKGNLPLPALGTVLTRAGETDALGRRRPGMALATRSQALVTAPWAGTIRYLGPLLDYGNVIILEPGNGYLLVLAGLGTLYGAVGEVVGAGAALGLMGRTGAAGNEFLAAPQEVSGVRETETLYMEVRQGTEPVDPAPWFAATRE
ncbi:MAG: murein hydrolase activator EnvC family protein [Pseudorhodobacter sp.]